MPLISVLPRCCSIARTLFFFCFPLFLLLSSGCPRTARSETDSLVPPPPPPQTIAPGQTVLSEFPSDGKWHSSGYLARPGDLLKFRPLDESANLEPAALQMHIGRSVTQQVAPPNAQAVTLLGEIKFRVDKDRASTYRPASVQVEISNLRASE